MRRLNVVLVLPDFEAEGHPHWRLDCGTADFAVALGCVAVTTGEEGAGGADGEDEFCSAGDVAAVDVAAGVEGWDWGEGAGLGWGYAHGAHEGVDWDVDFVVEVGESGGGRGYVAVGLCFAVCDGG